MLEQTSLRQKSWTPAPMCTTTEQVQARLLAQRALQTPDAIRHYLQPSLADLPEPLLLADLDVAIERIQQAIANSERIMVYGDFDADGVMSTVTLVHAMQALGGMVSYRIPDRVRDSHGLKMDLIEEIAAQGVSLLITCDCGTNDIAEVQQAVELGLDVIITDHHESDPGRFPVDAIAVVNPQRADCDYPYKHLAGVGVAFCLVMALARDMLEPDALALFLRPYLETTTIGLIADCMPLTGPNRTLSHFGLAGLADSHWPGLAELLQGEETIDAETVSFLIAPRINAASRMGDVLHAVQLFLGHASRHPERIAHLESLNTDRKHLTHTLTERAQQQVEPDMPCVCVLLPDCPAGVAGLVAGRLAEWQSVPAVVCVHLPDGSLGASCRAPEGYHIESALRSIADLFVHFGGHAGAAGFRAQPDRFDAIRAGLMQHFADITPEPVPLAVTAVLPPELFGRSTLTTQTPFAPFGIGARRPVYQLMHAQVAEAQTMGSQKNHLRLNLIADGIALRVTGFFLGHWAAQLAAGTRWDCLVTLHNSSWRGVARVDVRLVDARPSVV